MISMEPGVLRKARLQRFTVRPSSGKQFLTQIAQTLTSCSEGVQLFGGWKWSKLDSFSTAIIASCGSCCLPPNPTTKFGPFLFAHLSPSSLICYSHGIPADAAIAQTSALRSSRMDFRIEVRRLPLTRRHPERSHAT